MQANLLPFYIFLTIPYFLPVHIMPFMELAARLMCSRAVLQMYIWYLTLYLQGGIRAVRLIIISEEDDSLVTVLRGTVRKRERDLATTLQSR